MASKDQNAIVEISEIDLPDTTVSAKEAFDLDLDMEIPAFLRKPNTCRIPTTHIASITIPHSRSRSLLPQPPTADPGLSRHW